MNARREVYLDYSASTPVDPRVVEAMMPYFTEVYGNPSSAHNWGRQAERAIEKARATIAAILNCRPEEIVFTSGGSESDNLALRGAGWMARQRGEPCRLITTPVEHSAVLNTVGQMGDMMDFETEVIPVDQYGLVDPASFQSACRNGAAIASVIYANNELGSINDLALLSRIARQHGILFHSDAVQAGGQLSLDVGELGVDLLSLSAHKFYGPKGVGILFVKDGIDLASAQTGGSHEGDRRAGTHNTAFIVGMAKALELAYQENEARLLHFTAMRNLLIDGVLGQVSGAELSGDPHKRLPSHASFIFPGVDANALLMHLDLNGIAASSGSACKTGDPEPSEILLAAGYSPEQAKSGLRVSVGMHSTEEDINYAVAVIVSAVEKLTRLKREMSL